MSNVVDLKIPTAVGGACKRMMHLLESKYLPKQAADDLETLMQAAMAWEIATTPKPASGASQ